MSKKEFKKEFKKKLVEETKELSKVSQKDLLNEMADVLETLNSLAEFYKIDFELIKEKQIKKRKKRGSFKKRLFLIWSSHEEG